MTRTLGPSCRAPLEGLTRVSRRFRHARSTVRRGGRVPSRRARDRSSSASRPACCPRAQAARGWRRRPCRAGSRRTGRARSAGSLAEQPVGRLGRVRAVQDEAVAALEPPGKANLGLGRDGLAEVGLGGFARAAEPDLAARDELREARRRAGRLPGPRARPRASRRAIASGVSPSTSACSERHVREQDDRRVDDVGRVEPAAEPGLDRGDLDALCRELRERGRRQRLELRRPDLLRGRPNPRRPPARSRPRRRRPRSAPPSRSRAATCTRRPPARGPGQLGDRAWPRSTCRSSRRRAPSRKCARGGQDARGVPGSARGRTPRARG